MSVDRDVRDASVLLDELAERIAQGPPEGLLHLRQIQQAIDEARAKAVVGLRAKGFSDRQIGEALGVTKQSVAQRWPRTTPGPKPGEGEVGDES